MRDRTVSVMPPKKPATRPTAGGQHETDHGGGAGDQQRIAPAIEQPGHDVAALIVGAEEIGSDLPGRADRRMAKTKPSVDGSMTGTLLAVDHDLAVQVGAERIGVRELGHVDGR